MQEESPETISAVAGTDPWWRHRWPWLLMLGPAVAVVGCVVTIVLAFQAYGDQAIVDGGSQHGLVVLPAADGARGPG